MEDLLNTRQTALGPEGLNRSIFAFGFPELTTLDVITPEQKLELGRIIEQTISYFEPRLRDILVTLTVGDKEDHERALAFRIDARLAVEPYDDVSFQTILEISTGHYKVEESG